VSLRLSDLAVHPEPGDNAAIAARTLDAGLVVRIDGAEVALPHTVLEGHRVVTRAVAAGEPLLSWGTPFATAEHDLAPGDYVCTQTSLDAVRARGVVGLPDRPTARNVALDAFRLDPCMLQVGDQVTPVEEPATFLGFARAQGPAGTRNHVAVVAVTSRSSAFVVELANRFADVRTGDFDGVAAVAHTEGGEERTPNNLDLLLRTLAGFCRNPNVGAVLLVDEEGDAVTAAQVEEHAARTGLPPLRVPHAVLTRTGAFTSDLARATEIVTPWVAEVAAQRRTTRPLSDLRIGLQCGGSDAFSGVSANPLTGAVSRKVIRHGGTAVLAETDELIGAEGYVLENVRSEEVARRFVDTVESFKQRVSWHGHSAEGNPSGGNIYRGLYNIVLKSIGAARKLDRQVRLDHVIGYAEPLPGPGFVFMDSPGNDLESVAGQVASGCNLIYFTTGNGSITNFPFVPTLKLVTTTTRYELLSSEMDVDAGRYLTGTPMERLTDEVFDLTVRTISGERTAGEEAGHSQVSIWRDWKQTGHREGISVPLDGRLLRRLEELPADDRDAPLDGTPLAVEPGEVSAAPDLTFAAQRAGGRSTPEHVALLLPTSLCSGQVALRMAATAEQEGWFGDTVTRVVALPHTEGCGVSGGSAEETFARTMVGYLTHPHVRLGLLLEHGCEKTHNDYFRHRLAEAGADPDAFGWASIQRDGGVVSVTERVRDWAAGQVDGLRAPETVPASLAGVTLALEARGEAGPEAVRALATVGRWITDGGGTVLLSSSGRLVADPAFREAAFGSGAPIGPTLAHGQRTAAPGWHVMRMPSTDWMETVTGLGASGAQLVLAHVRGGTLSSARLVPVVQVTGDPATVASHGDDLDAVLAGDATEMAEQAVQVLRAVASRTVAPRAQAAGNVGFQVTRGLLGTSM
jgi:altronate dehydratase